MLHIYIYDISSLRVNDLTLILLTWRKWWTPNNASKWQMGFNSAFEGLSYMQIYDLPWLHIVSGLRVVRINSRLQKTWRSIVLGSCHRKHYRVWSRVSQECRVLLLHAVSSPCLLEESWNSTPLTCKQACYHRKIFPSATDVLWLYLRNDSAYSVVNS